MSAEEQVFLRIEVDDLLNRVEAYHDDGWRFVQLCGTTLEDGAVEVVYSFFHLEQLKLENLVMDVALGTKVPSITDQFPAAFVFENETHDLFGVEFQDIAIDFKGRFYDVSVPTPMNPKSIFANGSVSVGVLETGEGEE